jgi:hypothetical protein
MVVPGAAAQHSSRTAFRSLGVFFRAYFVVILVVPIGTPLVDVAVHVVQAPGVGFVRTHFAGATQGAVDVGLVALQTVAAVEGSLRPCPACVFPLGLRRQSIDALRPFLLSQFHAEFHRVVPTNRLHREVARVQSFDLILARAIRRTVAWIGSHDPPVLCLGHWIDAQGERLRYLHLVPWSFVLLAPLLLLGRAHHELTRRDAHELHADAVGDRRGPFEGCRGGIGGIVPQEQAGRQGEQRGRDAETDERTNGHGLPPR